jgi:hypothetical protein
MLSGQYEVNIDKTGLQNGTQLISQESFVVEVKSGEDVANAIFLVSVEKKR